MGYYKELIKAGQVVPTAFADIRVISSVWPRDLRRKEKGSAKVKLPIKDKETYERLERKGLREQKHPQLMVVVMDERGLWLVGGYSSFVHCKNLLEKRKLPPIWKMFVVSYDGKLSWEKMVGLCLYAGLREVGADEQDLSVGGLLRVVSHFFLEGSTKNVSCDRAKREIKLAFEDSQFPVHAQTISDLVESVKRMKSNPVLLDFIERHEKYLTDGMHPSSEVFPMEWERNLVIRLYKNSWWSKEAVPVQLLLLVILVDFDAYFGALLDQREVLRKQVIKVLRQCGSVIHLAVWRKYEFFMEKVSKGGRSHSEETMLTEIGNVIFTTFHRALCSQQVFGLADIPEDQEYVFGVHMEFESFLPRTSYILEDDFVRVMSESVVGVENCLVGNGYIKKKQLIRYAEEGRH